MYSTQPPDFTVMLNGAKAAVTFMDSECSVGKQAQHQIAAGREGEIIT